MIASAVRQILENSVNCVALTKPEPSQVEQVLPVQMPCPRLRGAIDPRAHAMQSALRSQLGTQTLRSLSLAAIC